MGGLKIFVLLGQREGEGKGGRAGGRGLEVVEMVVVVVALGGLIFMMTRVGRSVEEEEEEAACGEGFVGPSGHATRPHPLFLSCMCADGPAPSPW